MKAPANTQTAEQYIATLPEERRAAVQALHDAIRKAAPKLEPHIASGMLGYGKYRYKYASGRVGEAAVVSLASQKNHISLYLCATENGEYVAEKNKERLGNVSVGRSCIRFKKLEDLNLEVAMKLVKKAPALMKKDPTVVG